MPIRIHRGFTLIELLVVVAIISVLITLLVPVLRHAREAARAAVCASNLRQLGIGIVNYTNDNDGFLPQYPCQNDDEISVDREWFRFWKGYLHHSDIAATPNEERRQIWELGKHVSVFDCPSTGERTNYGHMGRYPKTFDYRMSAHWRRYSPSQPATGIGEPIRQYALLPPDAIWLIDSASKKRNEDFGDAVLNNNQPMTSQEHPSYDLYPAPGTGGVYTTWFFLNTTTVAGYSDWPRVWHSPKLGNYSGNNWFPPGIHHRQGANILTPDGAAGWYPISAYLPELEDPTSWRSMGRLAPGRIVRR